MFVSQFKITRKAAGIIVGIMKMLKINKCKYVKAKWHGIDINS